MNFYDDQAMTTRQLFERFFPGRDDVVRLLMEPITYANGSTLEDPALCYGIVFSNFMSKGVLHLPGRHRPAHRPDGTRNCCRNGVDVRIRCRRPSGSTSTAGRVCGRDRQRPARSRPGR